MNTAEQVILIILAATLAIFLILAITATIKVIQILNHLKSISEKAEHIADKAEAVGDFFSKAAGPTAVAKLFASIAENVFDRDKKRKSK